MILSSRTRARKEERLYASKTHARDLLSPQSRVCLTCRIVLRVVLSYVGVSLANWTRWNSGSRLIMPDEYAMEASQVPRKKAAIRARKRNETATLAALYRRYIFAGYMCMPGNHFSESGRFMRIQLTRACATRANQRAIIGAKTKPASLPDNRRDAFDHRGLLSWKNIHYTDSLQRGTRARSQS